MGIREDEDMGWKAYAWSITLIKLLGLVAVFLLMKTQAALPFNPEHQANVATGLSFNTAVSFITNTNWQAYGGETTLSYLTQMLGLTVQNFLSAATGIAVLAALIRGITRRSTTASGTPGWIWSAPPSTSSCPCPSSSPSSSSPRASSRTCPPISTPPADRCSPWDPRPPRSRSRCSAPNGGGFFGANAAHPFENSSPLSNFVQMLTSSPSPRRSASPSAAW